MHPGVRHVVEARERAESWGVTIHPKNLNTFEKEDETQKNPDEDAAMAKKLSHLDGELRVLVEEALKEAKTKKAAEEAEMRALVDEALMCEEPTQSGDATRAEVGRCDSGLPDVSDAPVAVRRSASDHSHTCVRQSPF